MHSTQKSNMISISEKITVTTDELQELLSCGRDSAVQIGQTAGAKVQIGRRVLWNVEKIRRYVNDISV